MAAAEEREGCKNESPSGRMSLVRGIRETLPSAIVLLIAGDTDRVRRTADIGRQGDRGRYVPRPGRRQFRVVGGRAVYRQSAVGQGLKFL